LAIQKNHERAHLASLSLLSFALPSLHMSVLATVQSHSLPIHLLARQAYAHLGREPTSREITHPPFPHPFPIPIHPRPRPRRPYPSPVLYFLPSLLADARPTPFLPCVTSYLPYLIIPSVI
jgi:hypothetical protein